MENLDKEFSLFNSIKIFFRPNFDLQIFQQCSRIPRFLKGYKLKKIRLNWIEFKKSYFFNFFSYRVKSKILVTSRPKFFDLKDFSTTIIFWPQHFLRSAWRLGSNFKLFPKIRNFTQTYFFSRNYRLVKKCWGQKIYVSRQQRSFRVIRDPSM